jgi:phosphoenolpyruvate carboxylase
VYHKFSPSTHTRTNTKRYLLHTYIHRHSGVGIYDKVETIRSLAKRSRRGEDGAFDELVTFVASLSNVETRDISRCFAQFLSLANVAEQAQRIRRIRDRDYTPSSRSGVDSATKTLERILGMVNIAYTVTLCLYHCGVPFVFLT